VNLEGAKEVSVATTGHERSNFSVVLCITADGSKLPPMVIFKRKTVPKGCNSKDVISANEKGWMNSDTFFCTDNACYRSEIFLTYTTHVHFLRFQILFVLIARAL